jgi:hypothetical protein
MALRDQFEQELRSGFGERHEAPFVNDQQFDASNYFLHP